MKHNSIWMSWKAWSSKNTIQTVGFVLTCLCSVGVFAIDYTYDPLGRLERVAYDDGSSITYQYDPVSNILETTTVAATGSVTITPSTGLITTESGGVDTFTVVLDMQPSADVTIVLGSDDATEGTVNPASLTFTSTNWDSVQIVTVTGVDDNLLDGGQSYNIITAAASSADSRYDGVNPSDVAVINTDEDIDTDSDGIVNDIDADDDGDGLSDIWETANSLNLLDSSDALTDSDGDGYTAFEEYAVGTNPAGNSSKPEGANGINYVLFRDHFNDNQYKDRWYTGAIHVDAISSQYESGTELEGTLQQPVSSSCVDTRLESFAALDASNAVLKTKLNLAGYGTTSVGLLKDLDTNNRIEVRFDSDTAPYLHLVSMDASVLTEVAATTPVSYFGTDVQLRLIKAGVDYHLFVNGILQATVTNNGLGDTKLRPYIAEQSCLADGGFVDSRIDLIEFLTDRDSDGLPDINEDTNTNGLVDSGESDPLNPDNDGDSKLDGFDNCLLQANGAQQDADGDGYGNYCDPDFDNDLYIGSLDTDYLQGRFGDSDPHADLNGDGLVDTADQEILDALIGQLPGPSGLIVLPPNNAPEVDPDTLLVSEDAAVADITILLLTCDTDPDGDTTLSISEIDTIGTVGSVTLASGGVVNYDPNGQFEHLANGATATDSFSYILSDGNGGFGSATVMITISGENDTPIAVDDVDATLEDTSVIVSALNNDSDIDGDALSISSVSQGTHGSVSTDGTTVIYAPAANFNGSDNFTYTVSDGNGGNATATITITTTGVNDNPVAVNDTGSTPEDTPVTISVLNNDSDIDGDALSISSVSQGTHGSVSTDGTTVIYAPAANFNGSDNFTYTVSDGNGGNATATITITTTGVNDNPVAVNDTGSTPEDTPVTISVLNNDSDIDGDALSISSVSQGVHGSVSTDGATVTYAPAANFNGSDNFTYTVSDGSGGDATATVIIDTTSVNDSPIAENDVGTTLDGTSVTISVLDNDSDIDGDMLSISSVSQGAYGDVTADGITATYTPGAGHIGTDSFAYTVHDGNNGYATATVTVTTKDASATLYDIVYDPAITAKGRTPSVPVNQNTGIPDTTFSLTSKESCWQCHASSAIRAGLTQPFEVPDQTVFLANRHHQRIGAPIAGGAEQPPYLDADNDGIADENYSCLNCHAQSVDVNGDLLLTQDYQDCLFCHVVDGAPKTVHHDTPKAKEALCAKCHGSLVRNLDEGLPPPTDIPGIITPRGSNKPNSDTSTINSAGTHPGNCDFCHNTQDGQSTGTLMPSILGDITVFPNENNHHSTGVPEIVDSSKGSPCQWCHIIDWPAWYEGDPVADKAPWQMRACQRCHDASSLHGIEVDIAGDGIVPGAEAYNSGHIGNQDNCWGCHGNDSDMIPLYTGGMPVVTATTPRLDGISAVTWKQETEFTLDLQGNGFINQGEEYDPLTGNVTQTTFMPTVQLTDSDGNTTMLDPLASAAGFISVAIPGSLPSDSYQIQVKKGNKLSNPIGAMITPRIMPGPPAICFEKYRLVFLRGKNFSMHLPGSNTGTSITTGDGIAPDILYFWKEHMIAAVFFGGCPDEVVVTNVFDSITLEPFVW